MTLLTRNRFEKGNHEYQAGQDQVELRAALKEIESLMSAKANTPEGDQLDVLTTLVEAYERAHFPMDLPDAWKLSSSEWSNQV